MELNIDEMSLPELKALKVKIDRAIENFDGRRKAEAVAALAETAKRMGFKLEDLVGAEFGKKTRGTVAAKYVNPNNPTDRWTGRGRAPVWFREAIDRGMSREDLQISDAA